MFNFQMKDSFFKKVQKLSQVFLAVVIISQLSLLSLVSAQKVYYGIIINPALAEKVVNRTQTYKMMVNIANDFQEGGVKTFYPIAINFRQKGETGSPEFYDNTKPISANAAKWISFEKESYSLDKGQNVDVNYTITVPADAEPGGHYVAIIFSDKNRAEEEQNAVALGKEIGELLFLTVAGDIRETGDLIEFTSEKALYEFTPVNLYIKYKNNGNIHTTIGGNIFIHTGDITKPVATITINRDEEGRVGFTLPGATRSYLESWNDGFITTDENGNWNFDFSKFPKLNIGEYTATLKMFHMKDGKKIVTDAEVKFWILPWKLILVILVVAVTTGIVISKTRKSKSKRSARKSEN